MRLPKGHALGKIGEAADTLELRARQLRHVCEEITSLRRPGGTKTERNRRSGELRRMPIEYEEAIDGVVLAIEALEVVATIEKGARLDGAEAHELFASVLALGHDNSDVHPQHPLRTGIDKLAAGLDEEHPRFSIPLPAIREGDNDE
jgi:hypothetical protein